MNKIFIKFISFALAVTFLFCCIFVLFSVKNDFALAEDLTAYNYLVNFLENCPEREAGSEGCKSASDYLSSRFIDLGLQKKGDSYKQEVKYIGEDGTVITDYNVIGIKKGTENNGHKVIIGAHYDNYTYEGYEEKSEGAYDNGTGVAALLAIADKIKNISFDFDIEFVFYAAEELGLYGSNEYLKSLSEQEKSGILLSVNLDSVAGGDYTYIYADEVERLHLNYFRKIIDLQKFNVNILDGKKNIITLENELADLSYYHYGIMSDNAVFVKEGINSISIFSANLESFYGLSTEVENKTEIMHTPSDNLGYLIENIGMEKLNSDLNTAVNLVIYGITGEYFENEMIKSSENYYDYGILFNNYFIYGMYALVLVLGIAIFFSVYYKLKKEQDALPKEENEFKQVNLDEIFSDGNNFKVFDDFDKNDNSNGSNKNNDNPFDEFK